MPNLTAREVAEIHRRELANLQAISERRRVWGLDAAERQKEIEAQNRAMQNWYRRTGEWEWKRGPVEVLLQHSPRGLTMFIRVYGANEVRLELSRFSQKLVFDHVRHAIGNFGREQRENGALVGLKMLYINGRSLRSPSRHTPWIGNTLTSEYPVTEDASSGIYALWPARKNPYRIYGDLWNYSAHPETVLTRVLGTGRCVVGTKGWRAEHCMVTDIWCHNSKTHLLSHFREKGVRIHDWDKKHGHR